MNELLYVVGLLFNALFGVEIGLMTGNVLWGIVAGVGLWVVSNAGGVLLIRRGAPEGKFPFNWRAFVHPGLYINWAFDRWEQMRPAYDPFDPYAHLFE